MYEKLNYWTELSVWIVRTSLADKLETFGAPDIVPLVFFIGHAMLAISIIVGIVSVPVCPRDRRAVAQPHKRALRAVAVRVVRPAEPDFVAAHKAKYNGVHLRAEAIKRLVLGYHIWDRVVSPIVKMGNLLESRWEKV